MAYVKPSAGRGDRRQNTTNYEHPQETNLLDLHRAMEYNGSGEPAVRTTGDHEAASRSAFGEPISVPLTPIIQLDALYGYDPREFETFTSGTGDTTQNTKKTLFETHTGTGAYGYAVVRSNRIIRYRPGQGVMARFTAFFNTPQAGVTLRAGLFTQEQSLVVGYDGTQFGVLRQNGGKAEIVKLTVSSNTAGTATVTLNGVSTNITLTTTNTTTSAYEIAQISFTGWIVEQHNNIVYFLSNSVGPKSPGTYSVGGTLTGTIAAVQTGVADTNNWTYQSNFNIDKLDGTGASGITLDPSKLNIFQVQFRWLGAGEIRWAIENPNNGDMIFFHHERYSNRNTDVHLDNPSFKMGYIAANLTGDTITDSHAGGASMMAAVEGLAIDNAFPYATNVSKTSLNTGSVHALLTLSNSTIHRDKINLRKVKLKTLSVAYQGNDPANIHIILNGTKSTGYVYNRVGTFSSILTDTSTGAFTIANETPLVEYVIPANGAGTFDLDTLELTIPPGDRVSLAISSGQNITSVVAAVNWVEV